MNKISCTPRTLFLSTFMTTFIFKQGTLMTIQRISR